MQEWQENVVRRARRPVLVGAKIRPYGWTRLIVDIRVDPRGHSFANGCRASGQVVAIRGKGRIPLVLVLDGYCDAG